MGLVEQGEGNFKNIYMYVSSITWHRSEWEKAGNGVSTKGGILLEPSRKRTHKTQQGSGSKDRHTWNGLKNECLCPVFAFIPEVF